MNIERQKIAGYWLEKMGALCKTTEWGNVREDYSPDGDALDYTNHYNGPKAKPQMGRRRHRRNMPTAVNYCVLQWVCGTIKTDCKGTFFWPYQSAKKGNMAKM